jgi:tagatose-6-phosphate ketose/aldose isomerase
MSSIMDLVGAYDTAREIAQQPTVWQKVLDLLNGRRGECARFLRTAGALGRGDATIVLTGAGSSEFVGASAAAALRKRLEREVVSVPTTHLVTHPATHLCPRRTYLVVHFARSGDSPESLAGFRLLRRARPDARHLVITCNADGALGKEAAADPTSYLITLPAETNDKSLAMTSSFTSMALCAAGLGWLGSLEELRGEMDAVQAAARRVLGELADGIADFSAREFSRACYLGSDSLAAAMQEGALKMMEMTGGAVASLFNSFLGIRHGPLVFIDSRCVVVACLSSEPRVRRYEMDLLRGLRAKKQGNGILAVSATEDPALSEVADLALTLCPPGATIAEELRMLTDIVVCQSLAFHKSRAAGLSPDNPSPASVISRVVQGVTIYDR